MTSTLARPDFDTDSRFRSGILTPYKVSVLAGMPRPTVYSWMRDTGSRDRVIHSVSNLRRGWPTIPLVGLVEAKTLRALTEVGVRPSKLAEAAWRAREDTNDPYVLASEDFVTDGIDVFRKRHGNLFRFGDEQMPINEVVAPFIRPLTFDRDGYARSFRLDLGDGVVLEIDPRFNAGRLSYARNRVPAFAVLGALRGGDRPEHVAQDYNLDLVEVLRVGDAPTETQDVF